MLLSCLELGLNQDPCRLERSFLPRGRVLRTLSASSKQTIAACWSRWSQPAMATTNSVKDWNSILMTEDSSFHRPTKPKTPLIRNVPARGS